MNEVFYMVTFEGDCSSFFFHSKDKAKEFIWESYLDDFPCVQEDDVELFETDKNSLFDNDSIEDYAWIQEEVFED